MRTPARLLVAAATAAVSLAPSTAAAHEPAHVRCADAVVPVDWDRFDERAREDENTRLIKRVLLNANRYALTTWYHEKKPYAGQPGSYLDFGGVGENAIRPPTSEAFALAVSLATGAYDAAEVGVSRGYARETAAKLITSTAFRHKANSAGGWGDAWQSALWASMAGHAGWLLWDHLSSHDRFGVVINHNRIHPDYMTTAYNNASAAYTYTLAGMTTPRAALFNVDIMYNSLVDLNFAHPPFNSPGGTIYKNGTWDIYYPQSNDWGSGRQLNFVAFDVLAHEYGFDHGATVGGDIWANRHASRAYEMQQRHPDGRMYADDTEDRFFSKEEFVAFLAARSYLTMWVSNSEHVRFTNRAYPIRPCGSRSQQLVRCDREVADAPAGGVEDGVGDGRSGAYCA